MKSGTYSELLKYVLKVIKLHMKKFDVARNRRLTCCSLLLERLKYCTINTIHRFSVSNTKQKRQVILGTNSSLNSKS